MHLSAFFIFLISVTNEVRADFNDIVHASLLTLKHEKDSPTMHDLKFFAAKAGIIEGEKKSKNQEESPSSSESEPARKKRELSDDDDDWDDDNDGDWRDHKEHLPSLWGKGLLVVMLMGLISVVIVFTTHSVCPSFFSICPACCYTSCCSGCCLKTCSIIFFFIALVVTFVASLPGVWGRAWWYGGMISLSALFVGSCCQWFMATALCASSCSEDRDIVAKRTGDNKRNNCCMLCSTCCYRSCKGTTLKAFTVIFLISTFMFVLVIYNEGFKIDENGLSGFVYKTGGGFSATFAAMFVLSLICIIGMNAPFCTATAEDEAENAEESSCNLCCKLPVSKSCKGANLKAKAWYLFILAVCFSFLVAHSAGIIPGILFDCILERHGFSSCVSDVGKTNDDDDDNAYNDNAYNDDDDDSNGGNLPSVQIFMLPIFFCTMACCCWMCATALCTAACTEERKIAQKIIGDEEQQLGSNEGVEVTVVRQPVPKGKMVGRKSQQASL